MKNFNQIHNELRPKILGFLIKQLGDIELAKDLTAEAMVKIWNNLDKFDENKSSLNTWAVNVAKNVAIDNYRKRALMTTSIHEFVDDDGNETIKAVSNDTPHTEMVTKEIAMGIDYAMNKLPENYRRVAELFFKGQLSYEEISTDLSMPMGTVKATINRARKQLQSTLVSINLIP